MNRITQALSRNAQVSGYKINIHEKESYELFFVKGKLETLRRTDTCDKQVTVYVSHGDYLGDAQFHVYPSTTDAQLENLIQEAVEKALLIQNPAYTLPPADTGDYRVPSNFEDRPVQDLAAAVANAVFAADTIPGGSLNAVEIFLNRHTDTVANSNGLHKRQVRYDAMVEAIPTYTSDGRSVELYEQYNFANLDEAVLLREIAEKMTAVKARFEAVTPDFPLECPVILNAEELAMLAWNIAGDLNYASVYGHYNLFRKGECIQQNPTGDLLGITMAGFVPGCVRSARFDGDGLTLDSIRLVEAGNAVNYYGSNRYGQYLGETATGDLRCLCLDAGSAGPEDFLAGPYLNVVSMSDLQVDFYNDYIGGEVRLAYYHDGQKQIPVTGISISGKLSEILSTLRLSRNVTTVNGYHGPEQALLSHMKIY